MKIGSQMGKESAQKMQTLFPCAGRYFYGYSYPMIPRTSKTSERHSAILKQERSLPLTREEYRELIRLLLIGEYIRGEALALREEDDRAPWRVLQKMLSVASEYGASDVSIKHRDHLDPSHSIEKEVIENDLGFYLNEAFWRRLESDLAERDLFRLMPESERSFFSEADIKERRAKLADLYAAEFERNDLERLEINLLAKGKKQEEEEAPN